VLIDSSPASTALPKIISDLKLRRNPTIPQGVSPPATIIFSPPRIPCTWWPPGPAAALRSPPASPPLGSLGKVFGLHICVLFFESPEFAAEVKGMLAARRALVHGFDHAAALEVCAAFVSCSEAGACSLSLSLPLFLFLLEE